MLNSVDRDGTGFGFDIETINEFSKNIEVPLIAMGGAGKYEHFSELYKAVDVDAAATANLLNFISDAIPTARLKLLESGIELAQF